jgi:hypothetical protein
MDSELPFDDETNAALRENQRQRVHVSRKLLAAHKARDIEGTDAAQAELTALNAEAVEIQCAGIRRAQGAA